MTITEERVVTGATDKRAHDMRQAVGGKDVRIITSDVRGEMWATNSYWAVPLHRIGALWNGSPGEGVWWTGPNTKEPAVHLTGDRAPDLEQIVTPELVDLDKAHDLERVTVDGKPVCTSHADYLACPLYRTESGDLVGINPTFLALISEHPDLRITQAKGTEKGHCKPVAIWRPLDSVSIANGNQRSWVLAGVMMGVRV